MEEEILVRYVIRRCSPEERQAVFEWADEKGNGSHLFALEQVWGLKTEVRFSDKGRLDGAWLRLGRLLGFEGTVPVHEKRGRSFPVVNFLKYAAIVIVVFLFAAHLFNLPEGEPQTCNEVVVPRGRRVSLLLSDGTKVWLNAGSRFSYPSVFSGKCRTVRLEGEGYFEVARDSASPFIVQSSVLDIRVLGTKFNVKAYRDEPSRIVLEEGAVEVSTRDNTSTQKMAPRDEVVYTPADGLTLHKSGDGGSCGWISGELKFENTPLPAMAKDMERRYNVKIVLADIALHLEYFTCHFSKDLVAGDVLELLKKTGRVNYRIEKDTVYLYAN